MWWVPKQPLHCDHCWSFVPPRSINLPAVLCLQRSTVSCLARFHDNRLVSGNACPSGEIVFQLRPRDHKGHARLFLFLGSTFYIWGYLLSRFKRCPLRWQCPVNSPVTCLIWTLLIFNSSVFIPLGGPHSSVSIVTRLQIGWPEFSSQQENFLLAARSRLALGPTQPLIQWVPGALSPGIKWIQHETDHSPPANAEVKNEWSYSSSQPHIFMVWCLINTRDNFTLIKDHGIILNSEVICLLLERIFLFLLHIVVWFSKLFSSWNIQPVLIFLNLKHISVQQFPINVHFVETKIGRLVYSNSPPSGTVVIRIYDFFFALYLLFLPSHRYRTK
jgi:hypothetical protein